MSASSSLSRRQWLAGAGGTLAASALGVLPGRAQAAAGDLPSHPLRLVVPFGAGGVADLTARVVAQAMAARLGQAIVVENRPGAGGVVAAQTVARAPADGGTLLLMSNANAIGVHLFKSLPFDTQRDFRLLSTLAVFDLVLVVPAASPLRSLADLLARARAQPGRLNLGTLNTGSTQHLAARLFTHRAGIEVQVVPFNGSPTLLAALRGGQVDAAIEILSPIAPQIQGRAVRALAVLGERRNAALAGVPTVREAAAAATGMADLGGLADFNVNSWNALAVNAHTDPAISARLAQAATQALAEPAVQQRLRELVVTPRASTPEEAQALLASDIQRWGEVIRRAGIAPS